MCSWEPGCSKEYQNYIAVTSFLVGIIIIGYLVDKLVPLRIRTVARKTKWENHDLIVLFVKSVILFTYIFVDAYLALLHIFGNKNAENIAEKFIFILITFTVTLLTSRLTIALIKAKTGHGAGITTSTYIVNRK